MASTSASTPNAKNVKFSIVRYLLQYLLPAQLKRAARLAQVYWQPCGEGLQRRGEDQAGQEITFTDAERGKPGISPQLAGAESHRAEHKDGCVVPG
jgi:hypothetical protein